MPGLFIYFLMTHLAGATVLTTAMAAFLIAREDTDSYVWLCAISVTSAVSYAIASLALGGLSDRFGRRPVAAAGMAVVAFSASVATARPDLYGIIPCLAAMNVGLALFFTSVEGLVADSPAPGWDMARRVSAYNMSWSSGDVVGAACGTWLVGVGRELPFWTAAFAAAGCAAAILIDGLIRSRLPSMRKGTVEADGSVSKGTTDPEGGAQERRAAGAHGTDARGTGADETGAGGAAACAAAPRGGMGQTALECARAEAAETAVGCAPFAVGTGASKDGGESSAGIGAEAFARAGRIGLFFGAATLGLSMANFTKYAVDRGASPSLAGAIVAGMFAVEVLAFFILGRTLMWRRNSVFQLAANCAVLLGCLTVAAGRSSAVLAAGMAAIGAGHACVYMFSIFYSLSLPHGGKAEQGGVHEAAIGFGNSLGPILTGTLAALAVDDRLLFVAGAVLVAASLAAQAAVLAGRLTWKPGTR